jgi:serine/threonine-protein kinase
MTETPPPQTRVIGRYSILRELRRERHSVSYAAVDPVMNRQLVVKAVELLPAGPRVSSEERKRVEQAFVRQAQAAGRLQHPHIVTVFDAGLSHAFGFLVIERVNGRPLHELLAGGLRPEFVQCASIGARIADALECAHSNGVAHGHLGPQHVYLQSDGSPKVSGFGGWIDDGATGDEALAGTARLLPYFQNEITQETRQQDLKAIGQLLFMMLTRRAAPESALAAGGRPTDEPGSITRAARPETPVALARLVDQALLVGRIDGPKTAGALRDALTAFIWNERAENVAPNSLGIPLAPPPTRPPVHVATITPDDNVSALRDAPATTPQVAPTQAATLAPAATTALAPTTDTLTAPAEPAPALAALGEVASVPAPTPAGIVASPAVAVPSDGGAPAFDLHALLQSIQPWAIKYRVALFAVGAFFALSIFLGVVLGNLRHTAPAAAPAASLAMGAAPDSITPEHPAAGPKASVSFDIRPWGEIFIDGKATGVSPPLTQMEITGGHHHIEIHHEPFPAWSADVDVLGATPIRIEHGFE